MAVRWRKYFKECKPISCSGKRGKHCPTLPHRASGEYKSCGVWCVEFFDSNKEWQSRTYKDIRCKADARERLATLIGDRVRGQLNLPRKQVIPTLSQYCQRYLGLYSQAKETTRRVKGWGVTILTKYLGDYRLDRITPFIIERFRIERKEKDKVKDSTINDCVTILSHIFNKAIEDKIVDKNPCKEIKRLKVAQGRDRILTTEEISLLLNKLQGKDRLMVLFGLFCGLRLNETLKLTWDSFDFTKGLLSFVASKTGKLVTVPLSDYLARELSDYRAVCNNNNLFEDRKVTCSVVTKYSNYFSGLFKQLGIHGFTYHNLRHTFASLQADLGTGAITTMGLLGHSTLDMTLRYSHTGLESKRRAVEALTNHVLNGCKECVLPMAVQV